MGRPRANELRDTEIERLFRLGYTSTVLARQFGVTDSNISRVLKERGVDRSEGGHSQLCRIYAEAKREHRFFQKFGVPVCAIGSMEDARFALRRFREQRSRALDREIPWQLTFKEWWGLWSASGVWHLRGRKCADSTVMMRNGDVGPYAVGNVRIGTFAENIKESWATAPNRFDHRRKSA